MPLLLLLFIWFLAEIVAFIYIGGGLGIGETIVEIIATIILGAWLIKSTARSAMAQGLEALQNGGIIISRIIGCILLIIPGFLTDILGVLALLGVPFGIILTILGLGSKPNIQKFMHGRMMGGGFGGANPFSGTTANNPFSHTHNQNKDNSNPLEDNPVFQAMVKKQQSRQNQTSTKPTSNGKIIDGEVIDRKD